MHPFHRWTLALLCTFALLPLAAFADTCEMSGTITIDGLSPPEGAEVRCLHSGGVTVTQIDGSLPEGNYSCAVDPGEVELEIGRCSFPPCPIACEGPDCDPIQCNADLAGCARPNPCGPLAFLLLPPLWRRRHRS